MCWTNYASVIVSDALEPFMRWAKSSITVMSFERHGVWNQRQFYCLFNNLVRLTWKTSKFNITGPLWVEYIQRFPHKGSVMRYWSESPSTRLFVQQFTQANNKGKIKDLHFWFIVRRIRWPMDPPRKEPAIQEAFSCHRIMYTNNTSTTIASTI